MCSWFSIIWVENQLFVYVYPAASYGIYASTTPLKRFKTQWSCRKLLFIFNFDLVFNFFFVLKKYKKKTTLFWYSARVFLFGHHQTNYKSNTKSGLIFLSNLKHHHFVVKHYFNENKVIKSKSVYKYSDI